MQYQRSVLAGRACEVVAYQQAPMPEQLLALPVADREDGDRSWRPGPGR
ncbi:hypothetical protein [Streptomyces puniciscabiei]